MTKVNRFLAVCFAIALSTQVSQAQSQPFNDRRTSARASLAGSPKLYDGTYTATNVSGICGEVPAMMNFSGVASFIIEYPRDARATDQIQSISFSSAKLVGKATTTSEFLLNITVLRSNGGRPPAYVLNTKSNPKVTGTATLLRNKNRSVTLNVRGKDEMGVTLQMSVTCI